MKHFCYCISLKKGCYIACAVQVGFIVTELILYFTIPKKDVERAVNAALIGLLVISVVILYIGTLKDDVVFLYLYIIFKLTGTLGDGIWHVILYGVYEYGYFSPFIYWGIPYKILFHGFMVYTTILAFSYAKEKHHNATASGNISITTNIISTEVYGF